MAKQYGIDISLHRARQVTPQDFQRFSHIVALDLQTLAVLEAKRPGDGAAELSLLLDYVQGRKGEAVADPYYGVATYPRSCGSQLSDGRKAIVKNGPAPKTEAAMLRASPPAERPLPTYWPRATRLW